MKSTNLKTLGLGTMLVAGLASQSAYAVTGTITIGVAANYTATLTTLSQNFINAQKALGNTYTIKLVSDSSGNLNTKIRSINPATTAAPFDLFLSADKTRPVGFDGTAFAAGQSFLYAVGELEFWSPIVNNASVVNGVVYPLTQNLALANPATAPYGTSTAIVLNTVSGGAIPWPVPAGTTYNTLPNPVNPFVNVKANITATKSAITSTGTIKQGFIHQSSICSQPASNGVATGAKSFTKGGGTHRTYVWNVAPTHPEIAQYGIKLANIARPAGSGSDTLLTGFLAYLATVPAKNVILGSCYALNSSTTAYLAH